MRRGWTRFLVSVSALMLPLSVAGGSGTARQAEKAVAAQRHNEVMLAGIRPGRDVVAKAIKRYGETSRTGDPSILWVDACRRETLTLDADQKDRVEVVRVKLNESTGDCLPAPPSPWRTGGGLRLYDACSKTVALYGNPDSRSPSTRDGRPLELLYYAFDWAGPDVPQVMQVVCTVEKDGQAGRVVQITLAASSL